MDECQIALLYQYDQTLLGNLKDLAPYYFESKSFAPAQQRNHALTVLRYAVEDLLRWTPQQMAETFDFEVIKKMKLEKVIKALEKEFPVQLDPKRDYYWYAYMLYPHQWNFDDDYLTIKTYKDRLSGKISRLPKDFSEGTDGEYRLRLCLNYYLQTIGVSSIPALYADFARRGNQILAEAKLSTSKRNHFHSPLELLHLSLPESQRDEYYYHYYRFREENYRSKKSEISKEKDRRAAETREEKRRMSIEKEKERQLKAEKKAERAALKLEQEKKAAEKRAAIAKKKAEAAMLAAKKAEAKAAKEAAKLKAQEEKLAAKAKKAADKEKAQKKSKKEVVAKKSAPKKQAKVEQTRKTTTKKENKAEKSPARTKEKAKPNKRR